MERYVKTIKNWIDSCEECQKRKGYIQKQGFLQVSKVHNPMEKISMDLLELLETTNGFKFLLVVVDYATKWIEAFPVKSKTKEEIATIFIQNTHVSLWFTRNITYR